MSYLVTATLDGRAVAFGNDPTGTFKDGAWYDCASGRVAAELMLRWVTRKPPSYAPGALAEPVAFAEAQGGTGIVAHNRPGLPASPGEGGRPPVYSRPGPG